MKVILISLVWFTVNQVTFSLLSLFFQFFHIYLHNDELDSRCTHFYLKESSTGIYFDQ